jgi:hypothetical protein
LRASIWGAHASRKGVSLPLFGAGEAFRLKLSSGLRSHEPMTVHELANSDDSLLYGPHETVRTAIRFRISGQVARSRDFPIFSYAGIVTCKLQNGRWNPSCSPRIYRVRGLQREINCPTAYILTRNTRCNVWHQEPASQSISLRLQHAGILVIPEFFHF